MKRSSNVEGGRGRLVKLGRWNSAKDVVCSESWCMAELRERRRKGTGHRSCWMRGATPGADARFNKTNERGRSLRYSHLEFWIFGQATWL